MQCGILVFFTLYCYVSRPYRSEWTNVILCLGMAGLSMQVILIQCIVSGYEQSIFIDRYFYTLTAILNGFCWGFIGLVLLFCFCSNRQWPLTKKGVLRMVEHQDFAIYIIKKARNFQQEVLDAKNLSSKNKIRLSALVEDLTMQFNTLRGRQPMIMDSLLETIDSMRLMQKK